MKTHISYMYKEVMVATGGIKENKSEDRVKRNTTAAGKVEQVWELLYHLKTRVKKILLEVFIG